LGLLGDGGGGHGVSNKRVGQDDAKRDDDDDDELYVDDLLQLFWLERPLYIHERGNRYYGALSYFICKVH
jgi:hypothetical protein